MERTEIVNIVRALCDYYPTSAPKSEAKMRELVDLWGLAIGTYDYKVFQAALVAYVSTDTRGFFPTPGMLIAMIQRETTENPAEAWCLVEKALKNGAYGSEEEFAKLPLLVQKAVGSASQLRSWAIDPNYNASVIRSLFERSYNTERERKDLNDRIPDHIKALTNNTVRRLESQ